MAIARPINPPLPQLYKICVANDLQGFPNALHTQYGLTIGEEHHQLHACIHNDSASNFGIVIKVGRWRASLKQTKLSINC